MAGIKPKTADGYSADVTAACESTLLTLLGAFGTLKPHCDLWVDSSRDI
jgi:hypothetical protein